MNAQLGTDLAQAPTLGVEVGCALHPLRRRNESQPDFSLGPILNKVFGATGPINRP